MNVLEHIENDVFALRQLYKMLKKDGMLIILVPCHKFLYNIIDTQVGHFKRYTKKDLESKIRNTQFTIDSIFYFNLLGIIGWYMNGSLAKNPKIDGIAPRIFESHGSSLNVILKSYYARKLAYQLYVTLRNERLDSNRYGRFIVVVDILDAN